LRRAAATLSTLCCLLLACSGRAEAPRQEAAVPPSDCTLTLDPGPDVLARALKDAPEGAVLCLRPGTYPGLAVFTRSVTVRGLGEVVLDAGGESPALDLQGDRLSVALSGLTISGGRNESGGALRLQARSQIAFEGCTFRGNVATSYGGGAIHAERGKVVLDGCRFEGNSGGMGAALLADGVSSWEIAGTTVVGNTGQRGALAVREGAQLTMSGSTFSGNTIDGASVYVDGSTTRGHSVAIAGCTLEGAGVQVDSELAEVAVTP
jgi:predicted outer membrane repeat protein